MPFPFQKHFLLISKYPLRNCVTCFYCERTQYPRRTAPMAGWCLREHSIRAQKIKRKEYKEYSKGICEPNGPSRNLFYKWSWTDNASIQLTTVYKFTCPVWENRCLQWTLPLLAYIRQRGEPSPSVRVTQPHRSTVWLSVQDPAASQL